MKKEKGRRTSQNIRVKKNNIKKRKSKEIKELEKLNKKAKVLILIISIIVLALLIFPGKKTHILRRYRYSIKKLEDLEKYNVKLQRKREKYNETIKETSRLNNEYLNRLDVNVVEYINLNKDIKVTYFEKNKKKLEENKIKKSEVKLDNLMYFPLISKDKKASGIKYEKGVYEDKKVYILKYKKENLNHTLCIDEKTYYPVIYEVEIPYANQISEEGENNKTNIKKITYEYIINENKVDEMSFKNLENSRYQLIENNEERLQYIDKKHEIYFEGIPSL